MDDTESTVGMRAVRADVALKKLLDLLRDKGIITGDEAFRVLEEGADEAQQNLAAIHGEPNDA